MTDAEFDGNTLLVGGKAIDVGSRILAVAATDSLVLVLIDPDSYLRDPEYIKKRRAGLPAIRNLRAYGRDGIALWNAELPEVADYYHRIHSVEPLDVDSFSSFRCRIDARTGRITSKQFLK